ncbi:MAG: transposase [Pirellulales bacterium]
MSERLPFKPFNESGEVRIYYNGLLPHWRQTGCTYFVTFRLADSLPRGVVEEWRVERDSWLAARGIDLRVTSLKQAVRRLSTRDRRLFERHFVGKLFEYLDRGLGECVLRNSEIGGIVAESLLHFHGERLNTGDFVVMPNHVHLLATPYDNVELEDLLHSIKSYTANLINERLHRSGPLWMDDSYDHIVRDQKELLRIQSYIRANPEKARLATGTFCLHDAEYALSD